MSCTLAFKVNRDSDKEITPGEYMEPMKMSEYYAVIERYEQ